MALLEEATNLGQATSAIMPGIKHRPQRWQTGILPLLHPHLHKGLLYKALSLYFLGYNCRISVGKIRSLKIICVFIPAAFKLKIIELIPNRSIFIWLFPEKLLITDSLILWLLWKLWLQHQYSLHVHIQQDLCLHSLTPLIIRIVVICFYHSVEPFTHWPTIDCQYSIYYPFSFPWQVFFPWFHSFHE